MGFIKEVYSGNRAGLVVAFGRGETSANYFNGDSIEEAMKHFNIYLKGSEMYIKTEDEKAINNLGINAKDAIEFRSTVDAIITTLSDEQAIAAPILFPIWQPDIEYKIGDRVRYNDKLYKVIQDHTSQDGWEPLYAASLFAALLIDEENNAILAWVQPDATNAYQKDDKVIHNEIFWISTINNNVWEPGTVNAPWQEYIVKWENGVAYALNQKVLYNEVIYISLMTNNTDTPENSENWKIYIAETPTPETPTDPDPTEPEVGQTENITEWVAAENGGLYMIGNKVIYNGIVYESLIDNNVWSPEDYPAGWNEIITD